MSGNNGDTGWVARFKEALQQTEQAHDASYVASLFAEGARLTNLGGDHGNDATVFWKTYLDQFAEIRSEFTAETVSEKSAALEWQSIGTTVDGQPVKYRGVSVVDLGDDALTGFRTYYDSAAFVRSKAAARS